MVSTPDRVALPSMGGGGVGRVLGRGSEPARARRAVGVLAATMVVGGSLLACGDGGSTGPVPTGAEREAAILEAVVREVGIGDPPAEGEPLPVVYVVGAEDGSIDIGVQAGVAQAVIDVAELRFADSRSEVIDDAVESLPVRDDGVLLAVGEISDERPRSADVPVERYHSLEDTVDLVVSITWRDLSWTVASTIVVPDPLD